MDDRAASITTVTLEEERQLIAPFNSSHNTQRPAAFAQAIASVALAAVYLTYQLVLARLRIANMPLLTGLSSVSLVITLAFTVCLARSMRSSFWLAAILIGSAALIVPFLVLPFLPVPPGSSQAAAIQIFRSYRWIFGMVPGLSGLLLICLAVSIGVAISRLVREAKLLLPIAVVLALVDLYVVFGGGLVSQAESGRSPIAHAAMASLTVRLTPKMPRGMHAPPPLAVGFADYLFIALFFACLVRFGVLTGRTFAILTGVLCAYMLAVQAFNISLPALAPIAIVVIGCNRRLFQYSAEERKAMACAAIIVAAVLGLMVYLSRR